MSKPFADDIAEAEEEDDSEYTGEKALEDADDEETSDAEISSEAPDEAEEEEAPEEEEEEDEPEKADSEDDFDVTEDRKLHKKIPVKIINDEKRSKPAQKHVPAAKKSAPAPPAPKPKPAAPSPKLVAVADTLQEKKASPPVKPKKTVATETPPVKPKPKTTPAKDSPPTKPKSVASKHVASDNVVALKKSVLVPHKKTGGESKKVVAVIVGETNEKPPVKQKKRARTEVADPDEVQPKKHRKKADADDSNEKPKKKRRVREPGQPKGKRSAYQWFVKEYPNLHPQTDEEKAAGNTDRMVKIGAAWKVLSGEDRAKFTEMEKEDGKRYIAEMEAWKAKKAAAPTPAQAAAKPVEVAAVPDKDVKMTEAPAKPVVSKSD